MSLAAASRVETVERRLRAALSGPTISVEVVPGRDRGFPRLMGEELRSYFATRGAHVTFAQMDQAEPSAADVLLFCSKVRKDEPAFLQALRDRGYDGLIIGWFWDNHHAKAINREVSALVDIAIPAHGTYARHVAEAAVLFPAVPLCSTQWTTAEATACWADITPTAERSSDLYGGFNYFKSSPRTTALEQMIASGRYPAIHFADRDYFGRPASDRFHEWARYAVSLCLPYRGDLSRRFFDAWLTGQIPVVTPGIAELDSEWAAPHRNQHFVCGESDAPADIERAHQDALTLFMAGGIDQQRERHQMVLRAHMLHHRVEQILMMAREAATKGLTPRSSSLQ